MKKYKFRNFAVDATLTLFTSGLWLIWVYCRENRARSCR